MASFENSAVAEVLQEYFSQDQTIRQAHWELRGIDALCQRLNLAAYQDRRNGRKREAVFKHLYQAVFSKEISERVDELLVLTGKKFAYTPKVKDGGEQEVEHYIYLLHLLVSEL